MRKRFKAKVSGVFDIVQLSDSTFSEVRDKLKENNYQIDQQFTSRDECYIEAYGDNGMRCVRNDSIQRMKKWKKIQKSLIKKWNNKLCEWFGHKPVTVIEERCRGAQFSLSRKGGKKRKSGHWVTGTYQKCSRCGKKLSNFQRCW